VREAEESLLLEVIVRERLVRTQQAVNNLVGVVAIYKVWKPVEVLIQIPFTVTPQIVTILYTHSAFTSATYTYRHLVRKVLTQCVRISHRFMNTGSRLKIEAS
jgi:predicted permease